MRKFKNVNKYKNIELMQQFPEIDTVMYSEGRDIGCYTYLAVSVFDQWLGKENYHLLENTTSEEDSKYVASLQRLNECISESTKVYTFRLKGRKGNIVKFKEFNSIISLNCYCNNEADYFKLVIPEYECLYFEADDYTNVIYYKDKIKLTKFLKLISNCGLHTIEHWE